MNYVADMLQSFLILYGPGKGKERTVSQLDQAPKAVPSCMCHCENAARGKEFGSVSTSNLAAAFPHDPTSRPGITIFI
jgi:hypothetical protein